MEFSGKFEVNAGRHDTFLFISDIEKVISIIPDVQSSERTGDRSARIVVKAGLSTIRGKFNLSLEVADARIDDSVQITARGSGSAGSLDMKATYVLGDAQGGGTNVTWNVVMNIGGMVATMGSRVINGTVEKYISALTDSFRKHFEK
jgi:carbon monoxide dehydrogenase subunit G